MEKQQIEKVITELNDANVRYFVAGGVAVFLHGYMRYTGDLDLLIALEDENLMKAVNAFNRLGYRPRIPEKLEALADSERRHDWIENKKALVLPLDGQNKGSLVVDIFLRIPFSFEEEYKKVEFIELNSGIRIPIVNIDTLIQMKTGTGRGKDEIDILELKRIKVLKEQYNGR